jgi:alkylation response protein AidB-like acyl-CoA dehydrogenase
MRAGRPDRRDPPDVEAYRARLGEVLEGLLPDAGRRWAREGHVPRAVFEDLGRSGVFRERWRHGRSGGLRLATVMVQELSHVSGGLGLAASLHSELFLGLLVRLARTERQEALRDAALAGQVVGCFSSTEVEGGSDVAGLAALATPVSGGWHLVGRKCFTSNAGTADHAVVLARPDTEGAHLPAPFLVALDSPGVRIRGYYATLGVRSCDTAELELDVDLPHDALLGSPTTGPIQVQSVLLGERITASAQALTAGRVSLGLAVAFARRRTVGGRRLIDNDAIRQRLADASAQLAAADALLDSALDDAEAGRSIARRAAAVKLVAARTGMAVTDEAMQVLGGRGYLESFRVEEHWRDTRLARIGGGSDEVLREIIAGELDRADPHCEKLLAEREQSSWFVEEGDR